MDKKHHDYNARNNVNIVCGIDTDVFFFFGIELTTAFFVICGSKCVQTTGLRNREKANLLLRIIRLVTKRVLSIGSNSRVFPIL